MGLIAPACKNTLDVEFINNLWKSYTQGNFQLDAKGGGHGAIVADLCADSSSTCQRRRQAWGVMRLSSGFSLSASVARSTNCLTFPTSANKPA